MPEHTPGDWTAVSLDGGSWLVRTDVKLDGSAMPQPIAIVPVEADAQLIAASKDLLAALRNTADALRYCLGALPEDDIFRVKIAKNEASARAAIAKALGK